MKAIYASKLFRASNRKDKIKSAIQNPLNTELVTQLRRYLDDEYQTSEYFPEDAEKEAAGVEPEVAEDDAGFDEVSTTPSHNGGGGSFSPGSMAEDMDNLDEELGEDLPEGITVEDEDTSNEESDSDTSEDSDAVEEAQIVSSEEIELSIADSIDGIKGLLNGNQDTAGVNRAIKKSNELWLYYNDSINLNNVMGNVVEALNASNYSYLEFNRLARSDNAIVFEILEHDKPVKPVGDANAKK